MPCSQCGSDQGGNGRLCPLCIEENQTFKAEQIAKVRLPKQASDTYQRTIGLFPRVSFLLFLSLLAAFSVGIGLFYGVQEFQLELYRLGNSREIALLLALVIGSFLPQLCLGLYLFAFTIVRKPWWAVGYLVVTLIIGVFGVSETIFGQILALVFHLAYLRHLLTGRVYETAAAVMLVSFLLLIIQTVACYTIIYPAYSSFLG